MGAERTGLVPHDGRDGDPADVMQQREGLAMRKHRVAVFASVLALALSACSSGEDVEAASGDLVVEDTEPGSEYVVSEEAFPASESVVGAEGASDPEGEAAEGLETEVEEEEPEQSPLKPAEEAKPKREPYQLPEGIEFVFDEGGGHDEGYIVRTITRANETFKESFGTEVTEATVFVFHDIDGLRAAVASFLNEPIEHLNVHEGIQGQAWPRAIGIYTGREDTSEHILSHELFHVLQFQLMYPQGDLRPLAPPAWLAEGGAEYASVVFFHKRFGTPKERLLQSRIGNCRGANVSLADLEEAPGRETRDYDYCLGIAAANMLAERAGDRSLAEFWELRGQGMQWRESFEEAFGLTTEEFYREFDAWNQES